MVKGLGKAVASAILLVCHPDKYGIWNRTSQEAMLRLKIWPTFTGGDNIGCQYYKVNNILLILSKKLMVDLWTLDFLLWAIMQEEDSIKAESDECNDPETVISSSEEEQRFRFERQLHQFLFDNWDKVSLSNDWEIYSEPGDENDIPAGYEFRCEVGKIDLLAKHKKEPRWLVIELKRDQGDDQTVGQVLRYMGCVKANHSGDSVEGLIIAHKANKKLNYALNIIPNVTLMLYELKFSLQRTSDKSNYDE